MQNPVVQRARSSMAKQQRETDILDAARRLGTSAGIRRVTLTDIAAAVGMHKSALLRYFETREQIFLRLTAAGWREWGAELRHLLDGIDPDEQASRLADTVAATMADSLAARPLFCDLLAQAPLNLERNVSLDSVLEFKLVTLEQVELTVESLGRLLPRLTEADRIDLIAAATSLSGAFWQMATPGDAIEELYRSDPRLVHAVVDVAPRVARILTATIDGLVAARA